MTATPQTWDDVMFQSALRSGERSDREAGLQEITEEMFQSALRSGERSDHDEPPASGTAKVSIRAPLG